MSLFSSLVFARGFSLSLSFLNPRKPSGDGDATKSCVLEIVFSFFTRAMFDLSLYLQLDADDKIFFFVLKLYIGTRPTRLEAATRSTKNDNRKIPSPR